MSSPTVQHVVVIAEREVALRSSADLDSLVAQLPGTSHDVLVTRVTGRMKGFEKVLYSMLGLGTRTVGDSMHVLTNGSIAAVTFMNPAFDEWFARLGAGGVSAEGPVEFRLSNGQQVSRDAADCMPTTDAWRALREFVDTGQRPAWLTYSRFLKDRK